jgi:hypothetical protein
MNMNAPNLPPFSQNQEIPNLQSNARALPNSLLSPGRQKSASPTRIQCPHVMTLSALRCSIEDVLNKYSVPLPKTALRSNRSGEITSSPFVFIFLCAFFIIRHLQESETHTQKTRTPPQSCSRQMREKETVSQVCRAIFC